MGGQYLANPRRKEKNMPVEDIFSQRQKRLRGEVPDVYQYENIPEALRVQIVCIMNDAFEIIKYDSRANKVYEEVYKTFCREHGRRQVDISSNPYSNLVDRSDSYSKSIDDIIYTEEIENVLDVIELFFQHIPHHLPTDTRTMGIIPNSPADLQSRYYTAEKHRKYRTATDELNHRFRDHGVGYQYESGQIIRVESQYLHSEAVQPALTILSDSMYQGANAEFLSAHEHYRAKRYKECLNDCLKTFESCLKAICDKQGWAYGGKDTADRLVAIVFKNKLIPDFMQSHFSALRQTLKAGVPTIRNELGGHGQGSQEVHVPGHIAAYALHLTASNILLLAKAEENLPPDIPF